MPAVHVRYRFTPVEQFKGHVNRTAVVNRIPRMLAEVEVELIDSDTGWSPYLRLEDAYRIDEVREALRRGDIKTASRMARVFAA